VNVKTWKTIRIIYSSRKKLLFAICYTNIYCIRVVLHGYGKASEETRRQLAVPLEILEKSEVICLLRLSQTI